MIGRLALILPDAPSAGKQIIVALDLDQGWKGKEVISLKLEV